MLEGEMIRINLNYTVKALLTPMAMKSSTCMEGGRLVFCFLMRKMSFLPIAKRCSIAGGGREEEGMRDGGRVAVALCTYHKNTLQTAVGFTVVCYLL